MVQDVKPQWINFRVTQSAADTFTQESLNLPINPGATVGGNKVRVIELLRAYMHSDFDTLAEDGYLALQVCTASKSAVSNLADPETLMFMEIATQLVTSGAIVTVMPYVYDLTDGDGNGILVAVDELFCGIMSDGQAAARSFSLKLLYRYVDVSVQEFIGIVQSQQ